jgi:endonuclease YncB( thermonuclease family)
MSIIFACLAAVAVDGDTIKCRNLQEAGGRVRIARIDAPERGAQGASEAAAALARLIDGRKVTCEVVDADPRRSGFQKRDRYGRPVARCTAGGVDLGEAQIKAGHAVVWPRTR